MELALIGVSHKTAPVEVRERLAFPSDKMRSALESLLARTHAVEAMILSTCNRVEIVVQDDHATLSEAVLCEQQVVERRFGGVSAVDREETRLPAAQRLELPRYPRRSAR